MLTILDLTFDAPMDLICMGIVRHDGSTRLLAVLIELHDFDLPT
jgi:hypothetical protein